MYRLLVKYSPHGTVNRKDIPSYFRRLKVSFDAALFKNLGDAFLRNAAETVCQSLLHEKS